MAAIIAGLAAGAAYVGCCMCCKVVQECIDEKKMGMKN